MLEPSQVYAVKWGRFQALFIFRKASSMHNGRESSSYVVARYWGRFVSGIYPPPPPPPPNPCRGAHLLLLLAQAMQQQQQTQQKSTTKTAHPTAMMMMMDSTSTAGMREGEGHIMVTQQLMASYMVAIFHNRAKNNF